MMEKMKLVVPAIPEDLEKLLVNIDRFFSFLPVGEICVVGSSGMEALLPKGYSIVFIDEREIVDSGAVRNLIVKRTQSHCDGRRAGWYVQQFIKMGYARLSSDPYYLLWDSDTVPLRRVSMLEAERPVFDCKSEYHEAYFRTIEKLFPDVRKCIKGSFISEHMIIRTDLMRRMLDEIEDEAELEGENFMEKIINAVPAQELGKSGFSEFETFGTYVRTRFPDAYGIREWKSLRSGGLFYDCGRRLSKDDVSWLSRCYDAVSLEKWDKISPVSRIVTSPRYEKLFRPDTLEAWTFFIRAYRRIRGKSGKV